MFSFCTLSKSCQRHALKIRLNVKVYYISAEFLIGKLLSNNLINLGLYKTVKDELAAAGKSISQVEDVELEPSLGNGGLGRLASCFIDSMATLGINGEVLDLITTADF